MTGKFLLCSILILCAARGEDAVAAIAGALATHPVIAIAELHWMAEAGEFYIRLIRDPRISLAIDDIVIEFASRQSQPILDRYVGGAPRADRRFTQHLAQHNEGRVLGIAHLRTMAGRHPRDQSPIAAQHKLRVLAGDTKIDWNRIRKHEGWAALGDNNISFARALQQQVLAKNRRALVVLGSNHLTKLGRTDGGPNVTTRVEQRFPGALFVALLVKAGDCDPPCLMSPADRNADALLYLGPTLTLLRPEPGSLDAGYLHELDRRARIEWGERGPKLLINLLGEAAKAP